MSTDATRLFRVQITDYPGYLEGHQTESDHLKWQVVSGGKASPIAWDKIRGLPSCYALSPRDSSFQEHMSLLLERYSRIRWIASGDPEIQIDCEKFPVSVLLPWGELVEKEISLDEPLSNLLNSLTNTVPGRFVLAYQREILDEEQTARFYSILPHMGKNHIESEKTTCCNLVIGIVNPQQPSGSREKATGMGTLNLPDFKNIKHLPLSKEGPKWRIISPGLNLYGTCKNNECAANGRGVYIRLGFGVFNINESSATSPCPQCHEILDQDHVTNLSFYRCTYTIEGKQKGERNLFKKENQKASRDQLETFLDDANSRVEWQYLKVTVKK